MDQNFIKVNKNNYVYDILNQFNITESTETKIKNMMEYSIPYTYTKIYNTVYRGVIYYKSYVYIPADNLDNIELWFEGKYIYTSNCKVLGKIGNQLVVLLDDRYDDTLTLRYWINPNIIKKVKLHSDDNSQKIISIDIDKTNEINRSSIYAIADGKFITPISSDDMKTKYVSRFSYVNDLEVFVCKNLKYCGTLKQYETFLVGGLFDPIICGRYILNTINKPLVDVRFYPYVQTFEPGFMRVFSDISIKIPQEYLQYTRFMTYPENIIQTDPYNDSTWDKRDMLFSIDVIEKSDPIEVIFDKLENISREYYKIYDLIHSMDKIMECLDDSFTIKEMNISGVIHRVLVSSYSFNNSRDILFYKGKVYTSYLHDKIRFIDNNYCELDDVRGIDRFYILDNDEELDPNDFSILKMNSDNNSTIKNISYYLLDGSPEYTYLINFNKAIQTLYRNLLIIKNYEVPLYDSNKVIFSENWSAKYPELLHLTVEEDSEPDGEIYNSEILTNLLLNNPTADESELSAGDIFAEWVESTDYMKNLYRDDEIFICEINGSIASVNLSTDYAEERLDIFIFEDFMLNFRAKSTELPYNGILPDLLNSKLINESNLLIFDDILHDSNKSNYIKLQNSPYPYNTINNETFRVTDDMSIIYSKNIIRCSMYRKDMNQIQINELNSKIINLNQFPIYFDKTDFIVFINGRYIKKSDISQLSKNRFIVNFLDEIYRVDILYSSLDEDIFKLKNIISE